MNTKHTPGPWRIRERLTNNGNYVILQDVERQTATHVCEVYNRDISLADAANARLIAAAPELLAVVQQFLERCGTHQFHPNGETAVAARAAIAKAAQP